MSPIEPQQVATRDDAPPVRFGSAMLRRFGWFYRVLGLGWAFDHVRFEDHSVERIRDAQRAGPIVYVLRRRSALDHLALNTVLNRRRLPLSKWANGVSSFWWQPVAEAWRDVFTRWRSRLSSGAAPDPARSGWLTRAVSGGTPVTVFLENDAIDGAPGEQALTAIIEAQERCDRPIQLIPIIVVWNPAPDIEHSAGAFLLGSREAPSLPTALANLYLPRAKGPFVQAGEPVDLAEFVRRTGAERRTARLHTLLRRYLKRESKVVRGPSLLPYTAMKQVVLDNPPMRSFAAENAKATGRTLPQVQAAMSKEYDLIAANFSFGVIRFLSWAMWVVWNRVFSGYDIRDEDLDRIRQAARAGAPVLVPCHKSHFDYLLLSWVTYYADLIVPHVVAGVNLAIWPVSIVLRACGGFFIKRSFAGESIHPTVFGRYLRELLRHGYTVEFFIEGGRTRTGLLLRPKLGVLGMVIDAADKGVRDHDITLLPIAISYEQVAEEGAYRQELGGAEKEKESVGQLIQARSVLSRRFGRVYLRVGEPIRTSEILADVEDWGSVSEADRRPLLQLIGDRLVHRIGLVTVILPTSLVALGLLAHHRHGITHAELTQRIGRLRTFLVRAGALFSDSLERPDAAITHALDRFTRDGLIRAHHAEEQRVWEIIPEQRVMLDFHKNQVLQFFTGPALAAGAIRALNRPDFTAADLQPGWELLREAMHRELTFDPDRSSEQLLADALDSLVAHGALSAADGRWAVADPAAAGEILGLLRGLLESYLVAARAAARHVGPIDDKAFVKEIQASTQALLTAGTITRPESLGAIALRNALSALTDMGYLRKEERRYIADAAALESFLGRYSPMVEG